ncbi:helix-turn-helix domain-containing protein [Rhizobiaceae bacterium CRRU44]|uniref:Helix-turn-helix domain-containing protein n=1 Tax=Ferranicluibacter rubi TaxID=2715133 RepID=A0AA43ZGM6_9HYPH|nr:helix-turn-helix domain-containing protein [Ferranicluibacter rubi]NHT77532.1 helix-turn-helix domain-containing protein [Ferranicluibacter rubi]
MTSQRKADQSANSDRPNSKSHNSLRIVRNTQDGKQSLAKTPWLWQEAMMSADLPASAFRVALAILKFINRESGRCFPSFETIAAATTLSVAGVRKGVAALRKAGFLVTTKSGFNRSLDYQIQLPTAEMDAGETSQTGRTNRPKQDGRRVPFGTVEPPHLGPITFEVTSEEEPRKVTIGDSAFSPAPNASRPSAPSNDKSFSGGPAVSGAGEGREFFAIEGRAEDDEALRLEIAAVICGDLDVNKWAADNIPDRRKMLVVLNSAKAGVLRSQDLWEAVK